MRPIKTPYQGPLGDRDMLEGWRIPKVGGDAWGESIRLVSKCTLETAGSAAMAYGARLFEIGSGQSIVPLLRKPDSADPSTYRWIMSDATSRNGVTYSEWDWTIQASLEVAFEEALSGQTFTILEFASSEATPATDADRMSFQVRLHLLSGDNVQPEVRVQASGGSVSTVSATEYLPSIVVAGQVGVEKGVFHVRKRLLPAGTFEWSFYWNGVPLGDKIINSVNCDEAVCSASSKRYSIGNNRYGGDTDRYETAKVQDVVIYRGFKSDLFIQEAAGDCIRPYDEAMMLHGQTGKPVYRVLIEDWQGELIDYTKDHDTNWIKSLSIEDSFDSDGKTASVELVRAIAPNVPTTAVEFSIAPPYVNVLEEFETDEGWWA